MVYIFECPPPPSGSPLRCSEEVGIGVTSPLYFLSNCCFGERGGGDTTSTKKEPPSCVGMMRYVANNGANHVMEGAEDDGNLYFIISHHPVEIAPK